MNIYVFLTTLLIMVSTVGNIESDLPESAYILSEINGLTMEVVEVDDSSITIEFENNSEYSLVYGHFFDIEVKDGNTWHELPLIRDDIVFTLEGIVLNPGGTSQYQFYYTDLYGALPCGTYRIIKDVSVGKGTGDYKQYYFGAEFIIK